MSNKFYIDPDIKKAETLPADFYRDSAVFEKVKATVFMNSWQFVGDESLLPFEKYAHPFAYLEHFINEPLALVKQADGSIRCMSNVCTHRGNIVVQQAGKQRGLSCMYHGRRFSLEGDFEHMPEFSEAENFPRACEGLKNFPVERWGQFIFTGLNPTFEFSEVIAKMKERVGHLPLEHFKLDSSLSRDYLVNANWALYCDNYLEGFHVPFVHPALNEALDFKNYDYEIFPYCNLQIGIADEGEPCFDIPETSPDFGRKVYAYYFWLFPNLMLNFYPWGLSLNIIKPLNHQETLVSFRTYRFKDEPFNRTVNNLEQTELEDEAVVESVQLGIQSRYYQSGRFSPTMERAVHHFHGLVADFMG